MTPYHRALVKPRPKRRKRIRKLKPVGTLSEDMKLELQRVGLAPANTPGLPFHAVDPHPVPHGKIWVAVGLLVLVAVIAGVAA